MDSKEYHRLYYIKRKQAIFDHLGGVCVVCGTDENLHIDHIIPELKSFNISENLTLSNPKVQKELEKCQLLCKSHHIEKTAEENSGFTHGTIYGWMRKKCGCELCQANWRDWNDVRNAERRLTENGKGAYNTSGVHGNNKYRQGCRCDICKADHDAKAKEYRENKAP